MSITNNNLSSSSQTPSTPTPSGTKTFKKSFIKQYGIIFVLVPFFCMFVWLGLAEASARTASFVTAIVSLLLALIPFFQVSSIKVEPNKLTIVTFFEEKVLSAQQIKEIKKQSVRGRYGRVTNFVNIVPFDGKNYPIGGFSADEETIYGFLMNWWNAYKNK